MAENLPEPLPPATPRPRRRRWLVASGSGLTVVVLFLVVCAAWALGSTAGARFVLSAAGVEAQGLEGVLAGPFRAKSLVFTRPRVSVHLENVVFDWKPLGLLRKQLHITTLEADSFVVATAPTEKTDRSLPDSLRPPLSIRIDQARLKKVSVATLLDGGRFTPTFEVNEFSLDSAVSGDAWTFRSAGATTAAGRLDIQGSVGAAQPFPVDIGATFSGEREGRRFRLEGTAKGEIAKFEVRAKGTEGAITGDVVAQVEPFTDSPLKRLTGKLAGIDARVFSPQAPHTSLTIEADLAGGKGRTLEGPVKIVNATPGSIDQERLPVVEAKGRLLVAAPRYELTQATIAFPGGGSAVGDVRVKGREAQAKVVVKGLDLRTIHAKMHATQLEGAITADATPKGQDFEVALRDPRFGIEGKASIVAQVLTIHAARVSRGASLASVTGTMALEGRRAFEVQGTLERADPSAFAYVPPGVLNGKFTAKGTMSPPLTAEVQLDLGESRLAGVGFGGKATFSLVGERVSRADVDLRMEGATLVAQGAFGKPGDTLDIRLVATDLAPIGRALKQDLSGSMSAEGQLTGTFAAPAGRLAFTGEKLRVPGGVGMATARGNIEVGTAAGSPVTASVQATQVTRRKDAVVEPVAERLSIAANGTRAQHRIAVQALLSPDRGSPIAALSKETRPLDVVLQGGLVERAATPTWKGEVQSFQLAPPDGVVLVAAAPLTVSRSLVELGDATIKGNWGAARFALTRWTPARIEMRGASEGLLTRPLMRALGLTTGPRSSLVVSASWDVRASDTLDGFVRLQRISGDVRMGEPPVALGLETLTASLEAQRGDVRATILLDGKNVGKVEARAATTVRKVGEAWQLPRDAPLTGTIVADVPSLKWAAEWMGPDAKVDGRLKAQLALAGTLGQPAWRGTVATQGLSLRDTSFGFDVDEGDVALAFEDRAVRIERFNLAAAWRPPPRAERRMDTSQPDRGTITAEGRMDFGSRTGAIVVKASSYPISQLAWRFIAGTGEARLEAKDGALLTTGQFKADAGWFGIAESAPPSLSNDVLIDRGEGPVPARERQRFGLDLRLNLGDDLHFSGRGLRTRLVGDLRLRGEVGRTLTAAGSIRTVGGTYRAYNQELTVERGVLNFQGPVDNPSLNVLAVRGGLPVVAGVEILGNVARPNVRLYSSPDVPDHEKLSWLVLGKGSAEGGERDTSTLIAAANALLGANRDNRGFIRSFGLDEMRLGRGDASSVLGTMPQSTIAGRTGGQQTGEVFVLGKRLSKDIYVSYQQSLSEAEASLRFTYQLSERLQILLRAGDKSGLDAVYRWTFGDK